MIALESGAVGWGLLEKQEMLKSSREFYGPENVRILSADRGGQYFDQLCHFLDTYEVKKYVVCPRTLDVQTHEEAVFAGNTLRDLFGRKGVSPVVQLTDWESPHHRRFSEIVTSRTGVISLTIDPELIKEKLSHDRVFGPQLLALSQSTFIFLRQQSMARNKHSEVLDTLSFVGNLYEPRIEILRGLESALSRTKISLHMESKFATGHLKSSSLYWEHHLSNDLCIITGVPDRDFLFGNESIPHAEWRITEALACGSLVVAPKIIGLDRYLTEGKDYIVYENIVDAAEKIAFYARDPRARGSIARRGQERLHQFLTAGGYWGCVEDHLVA